MLLLFQLHPNFLDHITLILLQCHRYHHVITLPLVRLFFSHSLALSINYVRWLGGPYTVENCCPPSPLGWHCQFYLPDEVEPCLYVYPVLPLLTLSSLYSPCPSLLTLSSLPLPVLPPHPVLPSLPLLTLSFPPSLSSPCPSLRRSYVSPAAYI